MELAYCSIQSCFHLLIVLARSLSPEILCALYLFWDYCDVVWCPTTTKFTSMIERVYTGSCHHHVLPNCHLYWLNVNVSMQPFKFLGLSIIFSPFYLQNILTGFCGTKYSLSFVKSCYKPWQKKILHRRTVLWKSLSSAVVEATMLSSFKSLYFN